MEATISKSKKTGGDKLTLVVPMFAAKASSSGKMQLVAYSKETTDAKVEGRDVIASVTAGYYAEQRDNSPSPNGAVSAKVVGNNLAVTIPMFTARLSSSRKTMLVASTGGFKVTGCKVNDRNLWINLNCYYYPQDKK